MKILLVNDDGVRAPGLKILENVLRTVAEIVVVAPDRNRSGASNSLTLQNPIRVNNIRKNYYSVEGTPTDCVHLALTGLLDWQPDIVVSGINEGANLGDDVLYSGTVAAATEGRFLGLPSIAVSLAGKHCEYYSTAAEVAKNIVLKLAKTSLPASTILNINVPNIPYDDLKGYTVARLGTRHKAEPMIKAKDPRGGAIYWVGPPGPEADAGEGTDFFAIEHNYVSITPLLLDLTHYKAFDQVAGFVTTLNIPLTKIIASS